MFLSVQSVPASSMTQLRSLGYSRTDMSGPASSLGGSMESGGPQTVTMMNPFTGEPYEAVNVRELPAVDGGGKKRRHRSGSRHRRRGKSTGGKSSGKSRRRLGRSGSSSGEGGEGRSRSRSRSRSRRSRRSMQQDGDDRGDGRGGLTSVVEEGDRTALGSLATPTSSESAFGSGGASAASAISTPTTRGQKKVGRVRKVGAASDSMSLSAGGKGVGTASTSKESTFGTDEGATTGRSAVGGVKKTRTKAVAANAVQSEGAAGGGAGGGAGGVLGATLVVGEDTAANESNFKEDDDDSGEVVF